MKAPFRLPEDFSDHFIGTFAYNPLAIASLAEGNTILDSTTVLHQVQADAIVFVCPLAGHLSYELDFCQAELSAGSGIILKAGQVYRVLNASDDLSCMIVGISEKSAPDPLRRTLVYTDVYDAAFKISPERFEELKAIFSILIARLDSTDRSLWTESATALAIVFGCIFGEALRYHLLSCLSNNAMASLSEVLRLHSLLDTNLSVSRLPTHYSGLLHITPAKLNECVKSVTGMTAENYIARESNRRISRMLAMTDMTVSEIASITGYDPPYMSRVFTRLNGVSPSEFRRRYRRP